MGRYGHPTTNTLWIWILAASPLVIVVATLSLDVNALVEQATRDAATTAESAPERSGRAGGANPLIGLALWAIGTNLSWLDRRTLARRGIERPFPWAWALLSSVIYVVGRSIVVRRRTGRGLAPLWTVIVLQLLATATAAWQIVRVFDAAVTGTVI
ncbi:MAG: hypothetical protein ACXIUP_09375 [Microcella sp.]